MVHWQNWDFHLSLDSRVGPMISTVTYNDNGKKRQIMYQGSLGGMIVPYGDPDVGWYFKAYLDSGDYGMGTLTSPLVRGKDVPSNAVMLNETIPDYTGAPMEIPRAIAIFERYAGPEYKHQEMGQPNVSTERRELVVRWVSTVGNYDYIFDWVFHENGTIGKAYGYQLGVKHHYPEGDFDQVDKVLYDLKHDPNSRRIMTNTYNHADLSEMRLAPCAYSMTFNVTGNRLNAILNQRSQDMLTANNWNVCQYAALLIMFAKSTGFEPGELVHVIADAHIYDRHIDAVKRLIEKKPYPAPEMQVEDITDFYKFTKNSFTAVDYKYHEFTD